MRHRNGATGGFEPVNPTPEEIAAYPDSLDPLKPFAVVELHQGHERVRFIYDPFKFPNGLGEVKQKFVAVNLTYDEAKVIIKL